MKKTLPSILSLALLCGFAMPSVAAGTDSQTVSVTGTVTPGCYFISSAFPLNLGNAIYAGAPITNANKNVALVCSQDLAYSITPMVDTVNGTSSSNEAFTVKAYKDAGFANPLTTLSGISGTGNMATQAHTVHFLIEGSGPVANGGKIFAKTGTLSAVYNLRVTF